MRILHLIDQATVRERPARAALLASLVRHEHRCTHEVWFIGGNPTGRDWDIPLTRRMYPWFGSDLLEPMRLWANRHLGRQFDVVHPWSDRLARAVRRAGWRCPVADLETDGIGVRPEAQVDGRASLRAAWGIAEDCFLVGVIGDEPASVDAMRGLRIVGVVGEAGHPVALVVGPQAAGCRAARRIVTALGRPDYLHIRSDADLPWQLATGCDAVLIPADPADSPLSVAWAAAIGRPILAWQGAVACPTGQTEARSHEPKPLDATGWKALRPTDPLPVRDLTSRLREWVIDPEAHRMTCQTIRQWGRVRFDFGTWCERQVARYRAACDGEPAQAFTEPRVNGPTALTTGSIQY